ncbi:MAG: nitrile hydratase accessory protein [Pseudomonadota bacterium]
MNLPENIPGLEIGEDGPVFKEPWEASAFALVVCLHEKGLFEWPQWAECLGAIISEQDDQTPYFQCWLIGLERMMESRSLVAADEVLTRQKQWQNAVSNTPHGEPIELMKT